jgi:succinate dehydrogenase / fumarate reductase iron-sulfur subunit
MATQDITFKVFRYKQGDPAPHYDFFDVPCDENTTVLIALQDIRRDQDPTLMLRHSCHHASCGTCGMRINGKEELSCVVKVLDLGTSTVTVEPMENLPLVADLVVDMDGFYQRYTAAQMPYIRQSEFNPGAEPPEGIDRYTRYENCIECGLCLSACPVAGSDAEYLGPAAMAAAWRAVEEPRNGGDGHALSWVDTEHGCWRCHIAFECSEVCPSNVDPAAGIMNLRRRLTRSSLLSLIGIKR